MSVLGEIIVNVKYEDQLVKSLVLIVVNGDGPTLFGRNWLKHIRLNWKQIASVSLESLPDKVKQICEKYPDVLKEELRNWIVWSQKEHSEWATPIVVLPTPDGRFRICGDFKVTLNPVMSVDQYPPKPQDLYASLSGGKKFTTLDLSQAFLQLTLEEQSQKLVVINTHKGMYK